MACYTTKNSTGPKNVIHVIIGRQYAPNVINVVNDVCKSCASHDIVQRDRDDKCKHDV
jgi:hypothetical protein